MKNSNETAFQKLINADPVLIGCKKMGEVFPDFPENMILHAGPDIDYENMRGPHKKGVVGAAIFEGLARDEAEAVGKIKSGEIILAAANDHFSGAPGSGITSKNMTVLVVKESNSGIVAVAPPIEGSQGGGLGGWGVYNPEVDANLKKMRDFYAPLLTLALETAGGIHVAELFAEGLLAGDEEHTRQFATDRNFIYKLLKPVYEMKASSQDKLELLLWLESCKRVVHHIGCASAVASLKSAANVPGSTLVTAMCGNGYEFGIKISGTGEKWYTAPAPTFKGHYWSPEYTDVDSSPWLGDSSNVEAWGLGGMAAAASPALLASRAENPWDGSAQCAEMARICYGMNPRFVIPTLPAGCAPAGILADRAAALKITPKMHGGILSRVGGGQIGVGYARTPLACFEKAVANV